MPDDDATDTTSDDVKDATGVPADGGGDDNTGTEGNTDGTKTTAEDTSDDEEATAEDTSDDDEDGGEEGDATSGSGSHEFDFDAAEERLEGVEEKIEEGRKALADVEQDVEPEPDGPPVDEGDGAANAPPG